jgi:aspartate carbamoyltransferase catalytic subunit
MARGLADVDIVMMLRLQSERMHGSFVPSTREYFTSSGSTTTSCTRPSPTR